MARAYYSEFDPYAAEWLRNLIRDKLIADGDVDERDLWDVCPNDLRGYTQVHLCAGLGLWSYALRRAEWPDDRPIWTASFPCQPFSAAGKGLGFIDERHLWPAGAHLISQCRPSVICGEQVASKDGYYWRDLVQTDMEGMGYAFWAVVLPIAGVGGPGERHRQWWVGLDHPAGARFEGWPEQITESAARDDAWLRLLDEGCGFSGLADRSSSGRGESRALIGGGAGGNSEEGQPAGFARGGADIRLANGDRAGPRWGGVPGGGANVGKPGHEFTGSDAAGRLAYAESVDSGAGLPGSVGGGRTHEFTGHGDTGRVAHGAGERCGETRQPDAPGGRPILPPHGGAGLDGVDGAERSRLERHAGHGDGAPGWEEPAGSIAPAGIYGGLADTAGGPVPQPVGGPDRRAGTSGPSGLADAGHAQCETGRGDAPANDGGGGGAGFRAGNELAPYLGDNSVGAGPLNGFWRNSDWLFCTDGRWRPVEPGTFPLAYGLPRSMGTLGAGLERLCAVAGIDSDSLKRAKQYRIGTLKGYGNAISPEPAIAFIESWRDIAP